ncbi:GlxA family transcriptional regulator [Pelagibius sp. Alg239-R121]|uniref:GlxA family transcriptional regulator n=1 Tax=Pelagibius sp. Alg239-R121 TaxID=2993448 RepID=UPI0024A72AEE|nr:helix-turn-helix domain-containing protein [Pelagibius sp. Alg239-R121]
MISRYDIAFFIADRFSLFGYAVASEMFRFANEALGEAVYATKVVASSGSVVSSSNGTQITPSAAFHETSRIDSVILCSGTWNRSDSASQDLLAWLRTHHRHGGTVCSLASAVWTVAATGLLDGGSCAAHWSEIVALQRTFPNARFTTRPFVVDNRIWTCSGGDSVTDMILYFLSERHGLTLAEKVRRMILLKPAQAVRHQRDILVHEQTSDAELVGEQLLGLIEENIEAPLSIQELCARLSVPQRSLNRICHLLFGCAPKEVYLNARLERAKSLLANTRFTVTDIAGLCGFGTSAYFAAAFKARFNDTPIAFRRDPKSAGIVNSSTDTA